MVSLEQVQLLEAKVAKAIEYVKRVTEENASLVEERSSLMGKLNSSQKRLDELEILVMSFKEDQGRIEDGIMAALDRLSQFEEAFENSLNEKVILSKKPAVKKPAEEDVKHEHVKHEHAKHDNVKHEHAGHEHVKHDPVKQSAALPVQKSGGQEFFEIDETDADLDEAPSSGNDSADGELDIF